ncbi:AAA family ATPase [Nitrosomonas sp.]|uniref:AAA family ATPase n=1 Tax=Nitrosomonas sp. TaxID=42353 RepID=UPI00261051F4|nr:AAA family ATPase [Nitrosomonas sp.]MCW5602737.1 AAA family ATPase [Nitrosomonas sp.]
MTNTIVDISKAKKPKVKKDREVNLLSAAELKPEPISWLWNGYLARGKMQILGGMAGSGKTTIAMSLAATVSKGGTWPDGTRAKQGNVLVWTGEDDPQDTLLPRLLMCGADANKIWFIGGVKERNQARSFDPAKDVAMLSEKIEEIEGISLIIVDPIVSAISGDGHKNNEVRRGLQPLVDLAASHDCALLGITHFTKGTSGRDPLERITGSLAFGAVARVVMVAAKAPKEESRVFMRAKSNIGSDSGGFKYEIEQSRLSDYPDIFATYAKFGEAIEGTAIDILGEVEETDEDKQVKASALEDAKAFLIDILSGGRVAVKQIEQDAKEAGHYMRTVRRAKTKLRIDAVKDGVWYWELPKMS